MIRIIFITIVFLQVGCQLTQTKIEQQIQIDHKYAEFVKIDTRIPQKYYLANYPDSILFQASDYPLKDGLLKIAQRLALNGVGPNQKILIITDQQEVAGDEFYLEYLLQKLKITGYQKIDVGQLRLQNPRSDFRPQNQELWPLENIEIAMTKNQIPENAVCIEIKNTTKLGDLLGNSLTGKSINDLTFSQNLKQCDQEKSVCSSNDLSCINRQVAIVVKSSDSKLAALLLLDLKKKGYALGTILL